MRKIYQLVVILLTVLFIVPLRSEPYIALRTGYKCSQCHINRTGGGKRTGFGFAYSQTKLPIHRMARKDMSAFVSNLVNNNTSVGANFRVGNKTIFGTDSTRHLVGQEAESRFNNTIAINEANVYLEVETIPGMLLFYIDEAFAPGSAANRESFVMIYNLPFNSYIKFGRIMMPFGLRLWDDGADGSYVRSKSGFNSYGRQETAYEIGIEPGPFSLITAFANGMDPEATDKQITTVGSFVHRHYRLGASYSFNKGEEISEYVYGYFLGGNFGLFSLIYEQNFFKKIDVATGKGVSSHGDYDIVGDQLMIYGSLNVWIYQGINLKIAYDYYDPMMKWNTDEFDRWTFGLELFPIQFLQLSLFYRYRTAPNIDIYKRQNEDQLYVEFQYFF